MVGLVSGRVTIVGDPPCCRRQSCGPKAVFLVRSPGWFAGLDPKIDNSRGQGTLPRQIHNLRMSLGIESVRVQYRRGSCPFLGPWRAVGGRLPASGVDQPAR